ncbi:nitrate regulatory protein [Herbaspirillum robiniae]|uniref:ANTAR domain-containing protein n=1 Tax=Herbaspirillum robiniae TaxID=2014887 RepID=A0A246WPZ9_9BURK|nr:nitrate regulatory protein [Herbaspirillum robiniae]NUU01561.1 ANTAR domain-containing protein [Herbaspirillum robiniae]OWY28447.1 nitrate response regulator protein [Herbaspirillum robiniae]
MSNVLSYLVAARRCEVDELERLARTCKLVLTVGKLVHCLQQERGISNIYLASHGERYAALWPERVAASDAARLEFEEWLQSNEHADALSNGARLYTRIAFALHALDGLPQMRVDISALACSPAANSDRFKTLVGSLLALVFEAADVAVDPEISRLLIALFHLMQGKEFAGRERAAGAAAFAAGRITQEQAQTIEYHIDMQEQAFRRFESFAESFRAEWTAMQASLPLAELERMRRKLLTAHERALDDSLADAWYGCCSTRMDGLHQVEIHLADYVQAQCRQKIGELQRELGDHEQLFAHGAGIDSLAPLAAFSSSLGPGEMASGPLDGSVGPHLTQAIVDILRNQSERLQNLTQELATVRESLEERKLIERAKGILMIRQGLNEESAYRLLRQHAMNQNRRIAEVAQTILSLTEILPDAR